MIQTSEELKSAAKNFTRQVKFSNSLGKVKTDLTWLDLEMSKDFNFTFQQQQRQQHQFNAVYCIFMVDLLGLGFLLFNHLEIFIDFES